MWMALHCASISNHWDCSGGRSTDLLEDALSEQLILSSITSEPRVLSIITAPLAYSNAVTPTCHDIKQDTGHEALFLFATFIDNSA